MEHFADSHFLEVCDFLIKPNQTSTAHLNWNWARWEWMYVHPYCNRDSLPTIGLQWDGNKVVGAAIFDLYHGEAFCGVLPEYRQWLSEIYGYAWEYLRDENGLGIAVADTDADSRVLLESLGYQKAAQTEALNRCRSLGTKRAIVLSDQMFYQKLGFSPLERYTFFGKQEVE